MKKLKRRLSAAFSRRSDRHVQDYRADSTTYYGNPSHIYSQSPSRAWSLSDSMSQLADRLAVDGVIVEECDPSAMLRRPYGETRYRHVPSRAVSMYNPGLPGIYGDYPRHRDEQSLEANGGGGGSPAENRDLHTPLASEKRGRANTLSNWLGQFVSKKRSHMRPSMSMSLAVVQETSVLGSDGESLEVSPSTSDQTPTGTASRYIVNVKMRPKPTRKWSEEEIQKRLSLPADLRLPVSVVEKMNRTPTLDQPLTRKNRRASLNEIGFGKLETYEKLNKLGEGTYATVYRGYSTLTNKYVALKEIRLEQEEGAPCTAIREVSLLRNLRHANVVTLHDIIHTDRLLTLVFEYVDRDLKQYMDQCNNNICMPNIRLFLVQLLRGLAYCHQRRVLHRDLKPQNLLITSKGELKLADFGLARAKSVPTKTYSHEVVTLWYRPPDVLLGSTDYSTHIDMWGVGCIFFEMVSGRALFPGSTTDEQIGLIFRTLGLPNRQRHATIFQKPAFAPYIHKNYHPEPLIRQIPRLDCDGYDLLMRFLQYEGTDRISARDAIHHSFLRFFNTKLSVLRDDESLLDLDGMFIEKEQSTKEFHSHSHSRVHKNRRQSLLI